MAEELELDYLYGPFQPKPFYDSMIKYTGCFNGTGLGKFPFY